MCSNAARWIRFAAITLIFFLHALFYYSALGYDAVDDAYISFVYARNAILGYGLVFNPGERVEGFTNFLWTALMIPIVGIGLDVGRVSTILGALFAIAILALVIRFPRQLHLPGAVGWIAALLLAVDGSFVLWSVAGLETAMFAFLLASGAFFYLREQTFAPQPQGSWRPLGFIPFSGIFFALAAMTRPEAAAVFALTLAHQAVWRLANERRLFVRRDIVRGLAFGVLFVPYWLVRWRYYQSFFPNSFYAKVAPGGPSAQITRGWNHVNQFVNVHLGWWILLPAVLAVIVAFAQYVRTWQRDAENTPERNKAAQSFFGISYLALIVLAYAAYIIYVGGDWSVGRFFVPLLPFAYLLIAAGLVEIAQYGMRLLRERFNFAPSPSTISRAGTAALVLFALALAWASSWNGEYGIFIRGFDAARATKAREVMGRWLKANVPPGTLIAVDAAGQVPYFSGLPAVDMFGINDLHIGRLPVATLGEGTPGHEKFDLGYIIARDPRYVVIYGNLFDSVSEYRRAQVQWSDDPALEQFLTLYERKNP